MPTNQAAWFHANGGAFTVGEAPMPQLAADEILIRSHAIAFNPADVAVWKSGLFTTSLPATVGCDVAGVIAAVGHSASKFQVGDRVLAVPNWSAEDRVNKGSGQLYCAAFEGLTAKLPEAVGFTDGCVLPLALCTAASSLFQKENLGLPLPGLDVNASKSEAKVFLVWGGSSSVGSCAIQMARAAGLIVATTCGARNFEYCKDLGAAYVFDYTSSAVVEDIVRQLKGKASAGVFTAIISAESITKGAEIAHRLHGNKHVATVLPPTGSSQVPTGLPEEVQISFCWSTHIKDDEVGPPLFEWITKALAKGVLRCKPGSEVVGRGLEAVQQAVERMEKGVSATKLVVEIP
ncbi:hypothetical protein LTR35_015598 [Friedmanniomyces endolithicus]|uniref:Enoyl reductase (ER) domain-containing protein n=1 Tax=Friedmanniomyces endolithicus TaxID=329885 RepID=A0AAN6F8D6_9PEZI|nr:hypothetical protein LTR35_015598 [Friedmanniomyces endolithicus]KAK0276165.1 hypothetical protein LTS00_014718 [Friedmanniomyces endolithicus]KAK0309084.1 hypothetical protein LTR82_015370 [Friedmanniomyces endolithicus]KAK0980517.1 hypothetical protein LTR54_015329 [Friedmanniomyces endolithicus]